MPASSRPRQTDDEIAPGAPQSPVSDRAPARPTTRHAPSPTGALHLGNARTFLINWALARRRGWSIVLRVEDLDGPRVKPWAVEEVIDTLRWLGVEWDTGPIMQSHDARHHRAAMESLAARALAYPCELTRREIEAAASAPHAPPGPDAPPTDETPAPSGEVRFPAALRPPSAPRAFTDIRTNWRFVTPPGAVGFTDLFAGPQRLFAADSIGDFAVWTKTGAAAYQLAVVVDDHRQGVTHVVRGDDLLDSAARQLLLYRALGLTPEPVYCHVPLVVGPDGRRLAKRHGDTRVRHYRERSVAPERVIGLIASWSGVGDPGRPAPMAAPEFAARFLLDTLPRAPVVCSPESDAWLLAH